jgi:hypothetical protein
VLCVPSDVEKLQTKLLQADEGEKKKEKKEEPPMEMKKSCVDMPPTATAKCSDGVTEAPWRHT